MTSFSSLSESLEKRQIPIYVGSLCIGLSIGFLFSGMQALDIALNPALALMMYATFLQIPLRGLAAALRQGRFLCALLLANFVFIPVLVWLLLWLAPSDNSIRFAIALVLLAPCIDYVVVFSRLGQADARALLAATPLLLITQILALPLLLPLVTNAHALNHLNVAPVVSAFAWIVVLPLLAAALTQAAGKGTKLSRISNQYLMLLPVPSTALVLLIVAAVIAPQASLTGHFAGQIVLVYVLYALLAPTVGWVCAKCLKLPVPLQRSTAFSAGTRNSLVVLPIAIAVPDVGHLLAAVIVMQTLVELVGELLYVRWMPNIINETSSTGQKRLHALHGHDGGKDA